MSQVFKHSVRVPYAHIDKMGIVYYANYFVYFEMARAQLLRDIGMPYGELEDRGIMLPVVAAHCDYRKPAHYDDLLGIQCTVEFRKSRLRIDYEIKRGNDPIVTGYSEHVCMSPGGKPLKPPDELRSLFDG